MLVPTLARYFVAPPLGAASPRADCAVPPVKLRAVVPLEQRRGGPPRRVPSGPHPLSPAPALGQIGRTSEL